MKITVNGDLFTLKKGIHELNLTVGGVPFKEDGLLNKVIDEVIFLFIVFFSVLAIHFSLWFFTLAIYSKNKKGER